MTHINHLPADDESLITTEFDDNDPATWPDTSYAGNERDLAYALSEETMAWYDTAIDYTDEDQEDEQHHAAFNLFLLIIMHPAAARALIDERFTDDEVDAFRQQMEDDANENSGDYFTTAMRTRLTAYRTLMDLTAQFRRKTNES